MRAIVAGLLGALLLVLAAPARGQDVPVEITLTLDRSAYEPGVPLSFAVRVRNVSGSPLTIGFSTSQKFDLVLSSETVEIDRWSRTQAFSQMLTQLQLAPGQAQTYTGSWLPTSELLPTGSPVATSRPLPRGVFQVVAVLTALQYRAASRPQPLIIGTPTVLAAGCTTLPSPFTLELPVEAVARAVDPPEAVASLWQPSIVGVYAGYQPQSPVANDLRVINRLHPLTLCLTLPARVILP